MFLLDDAYETLVAFLMGFDAAVDGELFCGFDPWLRDFIKEPESSLHWSSVIRGKALRDQAATPFNHTKTVDMSAKSLLLDLLQQFLKRESRQ